MRVGITVRIRVRVRVKVSSSPSGNPLMRYSSVLNANVFFGSLVSHTGFLFTCPLGAGCRYQDRHADLHVPPEPSPEPYRTYAMAQTTRVMTRPTHAILDFAWFVSTQSRPSAFGSSKGCK